MSIVEEGDPALDPRLIRRIGYWVLGAGVLAGIGVIFVPGALMAAADTALVAASIVVALVAPEMFELSGRKGRQRMFNPLFLAPAGLLFFRGIDNQFVDATPLALAALIGAGLVAAFATLRALRSGLGGKARFVGLMAMIGAAAGCGGTGLTDVRLDASAPQTVRATIESTFVSSGRATSYYLRLPPWGPRLKPNSIEVSETLYNKLDAGDSVCIDLRRGALSIPWFEPRDCAPALPAPSF
jgi:hypothetical protein